MRLVAAALAALLTVGCAAPVAEAPAPVSPQPELNSPSLLCPLAVATGLPSQPAVTKTFTVMALLQLVDQGQVSSLPGTRALTLRSDRYRARSPGRSLLFPRSPVETEQIGSTRAFPWT
jgi:hypothetical protein